MEFGAITKMTIKGLRRELQTWYEMNPGAHRIQGKLTWGRVKASGEWPKLKAKAAVSRHAVKFALYSIEKHLGYVDGTIHDKRVYAVCKLLSRFYDILDEEKRFLRDAAKSELVHISENFMDIYEKLATEAVAARLRRWKLVQKFHTYQHLCERQIPMFGNGKWFWTYSDEDLQRIVKEIGITLHSSTICHMILYKWAVVFYECGGIMLVIDSDSDSD